MRYEELQLRLMRMLKPFWSRVISLDIETHVSNEQFLTNERILSISFARRISGNFMNAHSIEVKTLFLNGENDESEKRLLEIFNDELGKIKPLGVLGYGLRQYDIPLLIIKKQHYGLLLWKLIDTTESAVSVDLYHLLKYKRYRKLDEVIDSTEFMRLPLKRTKTLVPKDRKKKGREIYRLWKENRDKFRMYCEGDVHDILLIAEKLMVE